MRPKVSVILNSHNQARYLGGAVESVLAQTFADFELIALDSASTDGSASILRSYEHDPRVRLVLRDENASVSRCLNEALAMARGDYVSFLFSDDYYLAHKLERQVAELEARDETWGVVYGPRRNVNELTGAMWDSQGIGADGWIFPVMLRAYRLANIDFCTPLVRRSCLSLHPFNEEVFNEGEGIFLRLALTHRFVYLDESLVVLRDHDANAGKAIKANRRTLASVMAALRVNPHLPTEHRPLVDHYEAVQLRIYGWSGARLGLESRWVSGCFRRAARFSPRALIHPKVAVALVLLALPGRLRGIVNRLGHALRRDSANTLFVEG